MSITPPAALEALLFSAGEPIAKKRLEGLLGMKEKELATVVEALADSLQDRGLALIETDTDLELRTSPDAAPFIKKLRESELSRDLGKAGLETLAIVMYRNGATRGDIDWIRGVNSTASIRSLLLRGLIDRGEDPTDRRRARYSVTTEALAHLGAGTLSALPEFETLSKALATLERAKEPEPAE